MKKPSPREAGITRYESGASPGAIYRMHRFEGRGARLVRIAALANAALLSTGVLGTRRSGGGTRRGRSAKRRFGVSLILLTAILGVPAPASAAAGSATTRVSVAGDGTQANSGSDVPAVSGDGRYVAFQSDATNLVPGDTNGRRDVFVHDPVTGSTERVSVAGDGTQASSSSFDPAISADGRYVAFSFVCGQSGAGRHQQLFGRVRA